MPFRESDQGLQILLITSCETRRWIIPKGNIDYRMAPHVAAAQEAKEEAGAVGEISRAPLGSFHYNKRLQSGSSVMAKVVVFPLEVCRLLDDWLERRQRIRHWFSQSEAADAVHEPELREIIRAFSPPS